MSGSLLPLLRRLHRQQPRLILGLLGLGSLGALTQLARLGAVYLLVSAMLGRAGQAPAGLRSDLMSQGLVLLGGGDAFMGSVVLFVGLESAFFLLRYAQDLFVQRASLSLREGLHLALFDRYLDAEDAFLQARRQGQLLYHVLSAPVILGSMFVALAETAVQAPGLVLVIASLVPISVPAALSLLVLAGVFAAATELVGRRATYDWGRAKVRARERQTLLVREALEGIRVITLYGDRARWVAGFRQACDEGAVLFQKLFAMTALPRLGALVAGTVLVVATVMVLRAALGERFASSLPLVAVYLVAMRRVLAASARLVQARLRVVEHMALACHVYEEIDAPPRVVPAAGGAGHPPLRQGIVCQDVGLVFAGRPPVLNGVSVAIRAGEVTAIVGPSGAGKSSLLNLIVRLFDPTRGVVLVDGEDLAHLDLRAWRRRIGFVAQESFLVHGSVADNIVLGRPATAAQVEAAARRAGADAFVRSLPAGYQTVVGEQGLKLSGGQRQLLGIARAMLTGPEIVIFDEATSSLDSRSEALVQQAIQVVSEGRTVIVVAHRLSTIEHADRIIVLDRGRVVGQGTHASLLDACGVYRMLYSRQHAHLPGQTPVPALAH